MLNLFKKKETKIEERTGRYPAIVEEIHDSFFTSADKLLEEAKKVLAEKDLKDVEKGLKLKEIGFKQALQVKEAEKTVEERAKAEKLAEIILYYKNKYPLNKFITEESVNIINAKYGLVQGGLELYKGFVPSEKVDQIAKFEVRAEDKNTDTLIRVTSLNVYSHRLSQGKQIEEYLKSRKNIISVDERSFHNYNSIGKEIISFFYTLELSGVEDADGEVIKTNKALNICAPAKDMDLTGSTIVNNKVVPSNKLKVNYVDKDPVVLQPVKHGYLIVAAWGDEASDPLVVNEIMN